jgi:hypothetical protein
LTGECGLKITVQLQIPIFLVILTISNPLEDRVEGAGMAPKINPACRDLKVHPTLDLMVHRTDDIRHDP